MSNFKEIAEELSYRVQGAPNLKDNNHLSELVGILRENEWNEDAIIEFLRNLTEKREKGQTWKTQTGWAGWKPSEDKARYGMKSAEIAQAYVKGEISDDELDNKEKDDTEEKPTEETDEKKIESVIEKNTQETPQTPEEQEAVDKKLSKRVVDDLDYITEDADKFLENSNKVGAGERTPTYAEVVHLKKFAEKRRDQNNARKEFLETNPSEEEIKLYDETTPLWIHPKTKAVQREVSDKQLEKSKQYLKDKLGEKKYKALMKKLANSGGWQRGGFKYTAEELQNRASELLRQYLKHGGRCAVTGEKVKLSEIEPDHRIPISKGTNPERNKELDNPKNNIDMITSNVNQFKSSAEDDDLVHKTRKELYREDGGIRERKKREAAHKNARRAALEKKYLSDFKNDNLNLTKEDFDTMDEDEIKYLVEAHNKAKGMVAGTPEYKNRIIINVKQRFNPKTGKYGGGANRLSIKPERELVLKELRKRGYNIPSEKELNEEQRVVDDSRKSIRKQSIKDSIEILKYKIENERYSDSRIGNLKVGAPDPEEEDLLTPEITKKRWKNELIALEKELEELEGTTEEQIDEAKKKSGNLKIVKGQNPTTVYHEVLCALAMKGNLKNIKNGNDILKSINSKKVQPGVPGKKFSINKKDMSYLQDATHEQMDKLKLDAESIAKSIKNRIGKHIGGPVWWAGPSNDSTDYGAADMVIKTKIHGWVGVSLKAGKGQLKNLTINTFFKALDVPLGSDGQAKTYFLENFRTSWDSMTDDYCQIAQKTFNEKVNVTDDNLTNSDVKSIFKSHMQTTWDGMMSEKLTESEMGILTSSVGMGTLTKSLTFKYFCHKMAGHFYGQKGYPGWNEKRTTHFSKIFGDFENEYESKIQVGLSELFARQMSVSKKNMFYAASAGKTIWFIPSQELFDKTFSPDDFIAQFRTEESGSGYNFIVDVGHIDEGAIGSIKVTFRFKQGQMVTFPDTTSDYELYANDWSALLGAFEK